MNLQIWFCVLACLALSATISDQLHSLITSDGFVITVTERLYGLRGVLVWEVLLCYRLQKSGWPV